MTSRQKPLGDVDRDELRRAVERVCDPAFMEEMARRIAEDTCHDVWPTRDEPAQRRMTRQELLGEATQTIKNRGDYVETAEGKVSAKTVAAIREEYEYLLYENWQKEYETAKAQLPPDSCIFPAFDSIPGKPQPGSRSRLRWLHEIPE